MWQFRHIILLYLAVHTYNFNEARLASVENDLTVLYAVKAEQRAAAAAAPPPGLTQVQVKEEPRSPWS